jgi:hypothetical protein
MFNQVDRDYLKSNPFILCDGAFFKFKEICHSENNNQVALFVAINGNEKKLVSFYEYNENLKSDSVTAQGLVYELLIEFKRMFEIGSMK